MTTRTAWLAVALLALASTSACEPDSDGDGLTDAQELLLGTNLLNPDTDEDGLTDFEEADKDDDNDGLTDALESPNLDVDGDGAPDFGDTANTDSCVPRSQIAACQRGCLVGDFQIDDAAPCDVDVDCGSGRVCLVDRCAVPPAADAPADIRIVARLVDGSGFRDVVEGSEVPLILPPQGGKVVLIGVRAKNVTCNMQLNAGAFDGCQDPPRIIGREGRPVLLELRDDGFGVPVNPDTLQNFANIPLCASFASSRDIDENTFELEVRATEAKRDGEESSRTHVIETRVRPVCAEADNRDECRCECDADFSLDFDLDGQCPTIHDNDRPADQCP